MTLLPESQLSTEEASGTAVPGQARRAAVDSLLIFSGGMIVSMLALTPEFIAFQARFAMFAQEMLRNGPSFFPTTYDRPYPDYPATSTFLIYLLSLPGGHVTRWAAALPTAIVSALILVVTYGIGAMRCRAWGLSGALFALLTIQFLAASRGISLDQYTSLAVAVSFYLVYSADRPGRQKRLWLLVPVWILGFAFRGPIGLALPAVVVCSYYLWHRRWRPFVLAAVSAGATLSVCVAGLLAAAKMQGGEAFASAVLDAQLAGRIQGEGEAITYYWPRCFIAYALAYPLAVVLVIGRGRDILRRCSKDDILLGSLALWALVLLAAMSIPAAKKTRYMLPIVPAISLMASYLLVGLRAQGVLSGIRRVFLGFCFFLPAGMIVAVLAMLLFAWRTQPSWQAHFFSTLAALTLLAVLSARSRSKWMDQPADVPVPLAIAVAALVALYVGIAEPIRYSQERTRPFVRQVEALYERSPNAVVFFQVRPDAEGVKFMVNLSAPLRPRFLDSFDELRGLPGCPYVLMKEQMFRSLPADDARQMRLLGRGRIGHKDFVILAMEKRT
jgi:4-amino-4-deoxy-L-arabinose transferase-like glycosyltransferase